MTVTLECPSCGGARTLTRRPTKPDQRCNSCANKRYPDDWTCSVEGCDSSEDPRDGMCGVHYMSAWREKNRVRLSPEERQCRAKIRAWENFWRQVDKTDTCWLWTGMTADNGYGRVGWNGREQPAHRISFEAANGPVPEGLELDHLCRTRNCVRVDHLEAVTHQENMRRATELITHCPQGHPYAGDNLFVSAKGGRMCRTCRRAHEAKRRERNRQARNGEIVGAGEAHPDRSDAEAAALRHHPRVEEP